MSLNKHIKSISTVAILTTGIASAQVVNADVQYRVAYEQDAGEYVVYMTPDSIPEPDLALSAQVTLKIPHVSGSGSFAVNNLQSAVNGVSWQLHSTVNAPAEDNEADYLSFGMTITGGTPPNFGWVPGVEKRIFSFSESAGCRNGVSLLENSDAFNQLPNSVGTNPGNQFTNLGWASANNYLGNYGGAVICETQEPEPHACNEAERLEAKLDRMIKRLERKIRRLERKKQRVQRRVERLKLKKDTLETFCPVTQANNSFGSRLNGIR